MSTGPGLVGRLRRGQWVDQVGRGLDEVRVLQLNAVKRGSSNCIHTSFEVAAMAQLMVQSQWEIAVSKTAIAKLASMICEEEAVE